MRKNPVLSCRRSSRQIVNCKKRSFSVVKASTLCPLLQQTEEDKDQRLNRRPAKETKVWTESMTRSMFGRDSRLKPRSKQLGLKGGTSSVSRQDLTGRHRGNPIPIRLCFLCDL